MSYYPFTDDMKNHICLVPKKIPKCSLRQYDICSPTRAGHVSPSQNYFVPDIKGTKQFCPQFCPQSPVLSHYFFGVRSLRSPPAVDPAIVAHVVVCRRHRHPRCCCTRVVTHVVITHIVICRRRHRHNRCFHCYRCFYRCRFLVDCCMRNSPPHLPRSSRHSMTSSPTSLFAVAATATTTTTISAAIAAAFLVFVVCGTPCPPSLVRHVV